MSDPSSALSHDAKWRKICLETLSLVWKAPDAWIFQAPVVESPELPHEHKLAYLAQIPEPMDLRTIKKNVPAMVSPAEFEADMLLMFRNCLTFNKPGQDAFEMGRDLEAFFLAKWEFEQRRTTAFNHYSKSVQLAGESDILSTSRKQSREPSSVKAQVPSSSAPLTSLSATLSSMLSEIRTNPTFAWFELPVHQYPLIDLAVKKQYYTLIQFPMDFSTIQKNLPFYPSAGEFRKDLELIVTNSVRFNGPDSPVNLAARDLQAAINLIFENFSSSLNPNQTSTEWKRAKIRPPPPPTEILPPPVLRIKRREGALGDGQAVEKREIVSAARPQANRQSLLLIDRPMTPVSNLAPFGQAPDWRLFANHLLGELGQIREEGASNKLSWIFQKPIFKYELPNQIKRLYCLSIFDLVDISQIQQKLDRGMYSSVPEFEADVRLMLNNCLAFNDESQYPHKVGFVVWKHFKKYWLEEGGLKAAAMAAWQPAVAAGALILEKPNWAELRNQAANEVVKPGMDTDHVSAWAPLNDELLYEWRVSQRCVMQKLRSRSDSM